MGAGPAEPASNGWPLGASKAYDTAKETSKTVPHPSPKISGAAPGVSGGPEAAGEDLRRRAAAETLRPRLPRVVGGSRGLCYRLPPRLGGPDVRNGEWRRNTLVYKGHEE